MPDPQHASPPYPTGEPLEDLSGLYQDHNSSPPLPTPESGAQRHEAEEQGTKSLLAAYQQTFEVVEDLPAVVWVRWRGKGLRRFVKFPYLRWFIRYFLIHHIYRNLTLLNRRLNVMAAMNSDPTLTRRIAKPLRSIYKRHRPHRISASHSPYSLRHYWWRSHYEAWAMWLSRLTSLGQS